MAQLTKTDWRKRRVKSREEYVIAVADAAESYGIYASSFLERKHLLADSHLNLKKLSATICHAADEYNREQLQKIYDRVDRYNSVMDARREKASLLKKGEFPRKVATMKLSKKKVVEVFEALGFQQASRQSCASLQKKIEAKIVDLAADKASELTGTVKNTLLKMAKAIEAQEVVEVVDTEPAKKKAPASKTKAAATSAKKAPAKKKKAAKKKAAKKTGPSNKLQVYRLWKKNKDKTASAKNVEKYLSAVNNEVKEVTIKSWVSAWNRGIHFPAGANE